MQVNVSSSVSATATVPAGNSAALLTASDTELANSGSFAPVTDVNSAESMVADDVYHPSLRKREDDVYQLDNAREKRQQSSMQQALSEGELDQLRQLKERDQEVRAHEQAHASVGGAHAGSASFTYQMGPDGVRYAIGGEVDVDLSVVNGDPQATVDKMEQIQRAALAPAEPSSQDRQVAAVAGQQAAKALAELADTQQSSRSTEIRRLETEREEIKAELDKAKREQQEAEEKDKQEEAVSAAERFAEYNAKLRRINEVLLRIGMPAPVAAGQILDDLA